MWILLGILSAFTFHKAQTLLRWVRDGTMIWNGAGAVMRRWEDLGDNWRGGSEAETWINTSIASCLRYLETRSSENPHGKKVWDRLQVRDCTEDSAVYSCQYIYTNTGRLYPKIMLLEISNRKIQLKLPQIIEQNKWNSHWLETINQGSVKSLTLLNF